MNKELLDLELINELRLSDYDQYGYNPYYQELNKLYLQYLENIVTFYQENHITSIIEIYRIYQLLLYNGILSKNKTFHRTTEPLYDPLDNTAISIALGLGSCRHISSLLIDIYNSLDKDAIRIFTKTPNYIDPLKLINIKHVTVLVSDPITQETYHIDPMSQFLINYHQKKLTTPVINRTATKAISQNINNGASYDLINKNETNGKLQLKLSLIKPEEVAKKRFCYTESLKYNKEELQTYYKRLTNTQNYNIPMLEQIFRNADIKYKNLLSQGKVKQLYQKNKPIIDRINETIEKRINSASSEFSQNKTRTRQK